jgi:hypothetical protein
MKALLSLDKKLPKIMAKVYDKAFKIMVGSRGAGGGSKQNQIFLNNFNKNWRTQRTYEELTPETEDGKENRSEDKILVSSGELMRAMRDTIRTKMSGDKMTATITVPKYGIAIQEGSNNMPARPYFAFRNKAEEKVFFGLIDSLLTLELNKLGLRAKENK